MCIDSVKDVCIQVDVSPSHVEMTIDYGITIFYHRIIMRETLQFDQHTGLRQEQDLHSSAVNVTNTSYINKVIFPSQMTVEIRVKQADTARHQAV